MTLQTFLHTRAVLGSVAALASVTLLLTGCSGLADELGDTDHSAVAVPFDRGGLTESEWQAQAFPEFYDQEIDWYECTEDDGLDDTASEDLQAAGYDLEWISCGVVSAPIDWEDPINSATIELRFAWVPALSDEPVLGSLFFNPGGPGGTATDLALGMAISADFAPVADRYDLVGLDPRGVGGSSPIDCSTEYVGDSVAGLGECIENNELVHTMGTQQVARDHELLRHLLGDEQLNFFGVSYGTMLGGSYATLFPERVGRMVLDSAENSEWATSIHAFEQTVAISNAVIQIGLTCTTDLDLMTEACPFTDEATLIKIIHDLDRDPLVSRDGSSMSGADLASYLSNLPSEWPEEQAESLDLVTLALFGDEEAIDALVELAGESTSDLVLEVIKCHEKPANEDWQEYKEYVTEVGVPKMLGGPEVTDELLRSLSEVGCDQLPEAGGDFMPAYSAPTAAPVLVFGITGDPATPYKFAPQFAAELGNATLVTVNGWGHGASYTEFSRCADDIATQYLLEGVLPTPGTECSVNG